MLCCRPTIFTFLGLSIANTLASNSSKAPGLSQEERSRRQAFSERMLCYTITIALAFGLLTATCLSVWGPAVLKALGTSSELMPHALPYLKIRALASPAVIVTLAAQGACLGQQDMWTPLQVVFLSGLVNLIGDTHLILNWRLGTVGAAVATTAAQYAGALFFLWHLHKKGKEGTGIRFKWMGLPKLSAMAPLLNVAGVLLSRILVVMTAYTAITAAATRMGTITVAAHQVALQVFWLLAFFIEPFSLTAQSLIARDLDDANKVQHMAHLLLLMGGVTGAVLAMAQGILLFGLPRLFSPNPSVIGTFQSIAPHAMIALFACSMAMMCDGVSIGAGQMSHLPRMLAVSMVLTFALLQFGQKTGMGLSWIWTVMVLFFGVRVVLHAAYVKLHWHESPYGKGQVLAHS